MTDRHPMRFWLWAALPPLTALALSTYLLGLPAFRAFVLEEEVWMQAGFALYFFTVPLVIGLVPVTIAVVLACLMVEHLRYGPPVIAVAASTMYGFTGVFLTFFFGLLA